jgi:hypothetical protein
MMYILRNTDTESGKYYVIETQETAYLCDASTLIPFIAIPDAQIVEVPDDYVTRAEKDSAEQAKKNFNAQQSTNRHTAYVAESDPIFFMSQRGEATNQEWLDKIAEIDARYPYQT